MQPTLFRRCFTEFIGTFILVLGIGIAISREISPLYIASITLATLISFYGYVSGGHFNPAVTLAFTISKKFPLLNLIPYWISQILGANFAVLCIEQSGLRVGTKICNLIKTLESPLHGKMTLNEPLLLEILGTFLFVSLILNIVTSSFVISKLKGIGIAFALVMVCTLFNNKADLSLNPARTLGPALFNYQNAPVWYPSGELRTTPYLMNGLIIALMSLIGGGLAGIVHFIVHKDES